jgi:plastocyanin
MRLRSLLVPSAVAVVVAIAGLAFSQTRPAMSSAKTSAVITAKTAVLKISNYAFVPSTLTVRVGTKITVTNVDHTTHTVTARSGAFDTGNVDPGASKSFTVNKPGVYPYYCQFHAFMTGTITVVK